MVPFGDRLRTLRKENRMTLETVARQLGVGRATVLKYETGMITNIPSDKIEMLAKMFGVSPAYLMCWTDDPSEYSAELPVVIPDSEMFHKVMKFMSPEDYDAVIQAFERTYRRMKANGEEI